MIENQDSNTLDSLASTLSDAEFKSIRRSTYIRNIVRTIIISNIYKKDKQVKFNIRFVAPPVDVTTTTTHNKTNIATYRDVDTGLIVADNTDVTGAKQTASVSDAFKDLIVDIVNEEFEKKLKELKQLYADNPNKYLETYKPIDAISDQGHNEIIDRWGIFKQVDSLIRTLDNHKIIKLNEFLAYKDTKITNQNVTFKTTYNDPVNQTVTRDEIDLVTNFLSAFLTPHAISVLSWYFGAAICNVPIYDDTISKALIVCSTRGGCGKTTLIDALSRALFTKYGYDAKPDFDSMFTKDNRFARSGLKTCRLTYYNEADFNAKDPDGAHDFSGLATTEIKSLLSDGSITRERKFEEANVGTLSGLHVILTNNIPDINSKRTDLLRRFIAISVKSSTMAEKGKLLGLRHSSDIYKFIQDNVQAFANVFAHYYLQNKTRYTNVDYNKQDLIADNAELVKAYEQDVEKHNEIANKELSENIIIGLQTIGSQDALDVSSLINAILNAIGGNTVDGIRIDDGYIYLDSRKSFFDRYNVFDLRSELNNISKPVKKFHQRVFKFPINIEKIRQTKAIKDIDNQQSALKVAITSDPLEYLKSVGLHYNLNTDMLMHAIDKVKHGDKIDGIRIVNNVLFINSTKSFFDAYQISEMRDYLRHDFEPVKKFGLRMFKLGKIE